MTAPRRVSSCHVPWPAATTNELPPRRAIAACNDASVRSDGLKNSRPRIFPAKAPRLGFLRETFGEREQFEDLLTLKIREIEEIFHQRSTSAARSRSTCSSLRMKAGSRRRIEGSPAVPARMSRASSAF